MEGPATNPPARLARLILAAAIGVGVAALVGVWLLIAPKTLPAAELAAPFVPDLKNGETMFVAGNCSGCHMSPGQGDRSRLGGGRRLSTSFGVFVAPNISSDPRFGIGTWSEAEFLNAMKRGTGRRGEHLYPAFPYSAYSRMRTADVRDLYRYMKTLPPVARPTAAHELRFPFQIRTGVGVWKALYFRPHDFVPDPRRAASWNRGAYLAEGAAHCVECHTPRDRLGGPRTGLAYTGAPALEIGDRFASNITPHRDGIGDWNQSDIADFLASGQDKCFNEPTGMSEVIASTRNLSAPDVAALAEYIHSLPPRPGNGKHKSC